MPNKIGKTAAMNAILTTGYVLAVSTFLSHTKDIFGGEEPKTVLVPMMMLLLLICSAGLTGWLVFGRPVLWYLDGHKADAVRLFSYTLGWLFVITFAVFLAFYISTR